MIAAGFDLGSTLGWSLYDSHNNAFDSGIVQFKNRARAHPGKRYKDYSDFIFNHLQLSGVDKVYYEQVETHTSRVGNRTTFNVKAAHLYGFYKCTLMEFCSQMDIPCHGVAVGRVKKVATGKGNANKAMMLQAAKNAFGHKKIVDDNEADALWVLVQGMLEHTGKYIIADGAGHNQGVML